MFYCPNDCNQLAGRGVCNQVSHQCTCNPGWTLGPNNDCSSGTPRRSPSSLHQKLTGLCCSQDAAPVHCHRRCVGPHWHGRGAVLHHCHHPGAGVQRRRLLCVCHARRSRLLREPGPVCGLQRRADPDDLCGPRSLDPGAPPSVGEGLLLGTAGWCVNPYVRRSHF